MTAGNSTQISDGASAMLIVSEEKANRSDSTPVLASCSIAVAGDDPASCSPRLPRRREGAGAGRAHARPIDLAEINEAFASVVLAWKNEHHPDMSKVNVNGGAIALGHPLGCSGAKLMATPGTAQPR